MSSVILILFMKRSPILVLTKQRRLTSMIGREQMLATWYCRPAGREWIDNNIEPWWKLKFIMHIFTILYVINYLFTSNILTQFGKKKGYDLLFYICVWYTCLMVDNVDNVVDNVLSSCVADPSSNLTTIFLSRIERLKLL